jgi:hypothetical protein
MLESSRLPWKLRAFSMMTGLEKRASGHPEAPGVWKVPIGANGFAIFPAVGARDALMRFWGR